MQHLRVGVLMGGMSLEKEVSLNSGRTICDHLDNARFNVIPLFQTEDGDLYILPARFLHRGKTTDFVHRLSNEAAKIYWDDLKKIVDIIYIAQHGRYGEDGCIQGILEMLRIPYVGSKVFASALGMDKHAQKTFLRLAGIKVPKSILLSPHQINSYKEKSDDLIAVLQKEQLYFPVVVKPHHEGSSFGVSIANNLEELFISLERACLIAPPIKQSVIIEEKISGMEFTCIVLQNYHNGSFFALPPTETVTSPEKKILDYEQKYMPGRSLKITPARCSDEAIQLIQETSIGVMKALGFTTLGRIDGFLLTDGSIMIIDPNSFSGFSPSSFIPNQAACAHMSMTTLINHLIETELHNYQLPHSCIDELQTTENNTKKIRVGVLFGGKSNEREISLDSGRNVVYKLSPHRYEALPIFLDCHLNLYLLNQKQLVCNSTQAIVQTLTPDQKITWQELKEKIDFAFLGLHGGEGENGCIQGTLELLKIPYNGSGVLASALCMDKYKTNQYLRAHGIDVPNGVLVARKDWEFYSQSYTPSFPAPWIIKPHDDGCSVMVQKAHTVQELNKALSSIFSEKEYALIEECIQGMELTVGVIGNEKPYALPPSQAIAAGGILSIEEKFLPGAGENQTPAPLSKNALALVKQTIERAYSIIGCKGYARIDCFFQSAEENPSKHDRVIILEINNLPGLTPATCIFHQAAEIGMHPMEFIDTIIQLGLEAHGQAHRTQHEAQAIRAQTWYDNRIPENLI
jgi:D-alanine--D-alanine ligase